MNDSKWDFLAPWLRILAPVVFVPDAKKCSSCSDDDDYSTLQPRVRYLGINPFDLIWRPELRKENGELDVKAWVAIGCAMDLVALALHLDPRVWGLIRDRSGKPLLDMTVYDPKDLGAGIMVKLTAMKALSNVYPSLFLLDETQLEEDPELPYGADRDRLEKMFGDRKTPLIDFRIPLIVDAVDGDDIVPVSALQNFFTSLQTSAPLIWMLRLRARYRLKGVLVAACEGTRSEFIKLEQSGVAINGVIYSYRLSHSSLESLLITPALKVVKVWAISNESMALLFTALSCGGSRISALTVCVNATLDLNPLAQALLLTKDR